MANDVNIRAVITAEDKASKTLKGFGDGVGGLSEQLKVGMLAAGAAVVAFGVASVKAFSESEDLIAQTNAVLKSTGQVAGVTADQVNKLSKSWEAHTKYSDEAVRGAENIMLTFTKIGKDTFPRALQAILDLSTSMHQDLQTSAVQVGKALQDPIHGMLSLSKVGALNRDDFERLGKEWKEHTIPLAQEQAELLQALEKEFKGSAAAAGGTFSGQLEIAKNKFNDIQEVIGHFIVDGIEKLISIFGTVSDTLSNLFGPSVKALVNTFETQMLPSLKKLYDALQPGLMQALKVIAEVVGAVLVGAVWLAINAINILIKAFSFEINIISDLIGWFGNLGGAAVNVAIAILNIYKWAFNEIAKAWNATIGKLHFSIPSWVPSIGGKGWDVPDIPLLAQGGIVTKPTLAMIGEAGPEAVVPLNKGGMGVNLTVNVGVYAGSEIEKRKLAQELYKALQDAAGAKNRAMPGVV